MLVSALKKLFLLFIDCSPQNVTAHFW